ncbi:hypothetical protein [Luteococcus japonicus]|uniref:Uncharacterized protein n=1 Tax=Luteococcus japonicus LSP_Lj1 TaxID=1255658 RepID=A0A1R4JA71_9ACTN|nr:hypothetical protein [Luteococcus japonicus]SJN29021.1 hypothetical protein FM114_06400 [Luteococcus japonicus LSP_Lj1]
MTDTLWTADARNQLAERAQAAAAALQAHAQALLAISDEDSYELEDAMRQDAELRTALLGYDDAAFDYSGSFPICLTDEDGEGDELPEEGGFEEVTALNASSRDTTAPDGQDGEPGFVSLVIRADLVVVDPKALADAVAAQRGQASADIAGNVDAVVEDILAHELVQVPGLQELRKAVFPLVTDELEAQESFEADPLGLLVE